MLILAHRGASKAAPENTHKAFALAYEMGADGIEFDVYQMPANSVIIHDRWLDRTTNGTGLVVDQAHEYLCTLDAGAGESIPLLTEVIQQAPKDAILNIEIKYAYDIESLVEEIRSACRAYGFPLRHLLISSFNHNWLTRFKLLMPNTQIGALTASYSHNPTAYASDIDADYANVALDVVDYEFVVQAHNNGLKVMVYTVDQPQDIALLASWGVDGIFTNVPDVATATLQKSII